MDIQKIVRNAYLVLFLFVFLGGVSSFTSTFFYASISVFALSELHPLLITVIAGAGLTLGDSFFFYVGNKAYDTFLKKYHYRNGCLNVTH